jgi:cystathionine beta-lyase
MKPRMAFEDPVAGAGFETLCTHYAEDPRGQAGAIAPPIYQASNFAYPDAAAFENRLSDGWPHYEYTRGGNPTTSILEAKLARLEGGTWAECFASGMGAMTAAINVCVQSGSHVVAVKHCYPPTNWYLEHIRRFGVETTYVNSCDPAEFVAAMRPETHLVYLESPTTGFFEVPEVAPIASAARERGITTLFDNSWATPYFQNPLALGCDLVVHSASKYLGGHSDLVAGILVGRDEQIRRRVQREIEMCGATADPFAAWLIIRGLRTLALRMRQHHQSALTIARMLDEHPRVARVHHPGLKSHPQHEVARRQFRGYSSLFSFELKNPTQAATQRLLDRLRLFRQAVSWGGYESLAMDGRLFSDDKDNVAWLIRLHIGLESADDLIADLRQALEA